MKIVDALADLFLGSSCPGCGVPVLGMCAPCRAEIAGPRLVRVAPTAVAVGVSEGRSVLTEHARPRSPDGIGQGSRPGLGATEDSLPWLPVVGLARYDGPAGRAIVALKEHQAWAVARCCGPGLARAVRWLLEVLGRAGPVVLVPVPSSSAAVRARGFDHGRALARHAARAEGHQWLALLRRSRRTVDQAGTGRAERGQNQRGSMRAAPTSPRQIVLVDDICTTGQTLLEASRCLGRAGHRVLGAVVVCDTPLHQAGDTGLPGRVVGSSDGPMGRRGLHQAVVR